MSGLKNIFKKFLDLINAIKTDLKTERLPVLRSVFRFLFKINLSNFRYVKNHTDTLKIIPKRMQLKTLFSSGKLAKSMMAIPALPYKFDEKGKDKLLFVPIVPQP